MYLSRRFQHNSRDRIVAMVTDASLFIQWYYFVVEYGLLTWQKSIVVKCKQEYLWTQHLKQYLSHDMTKPTKWVCAQRRLRSAWASAQSDKSLRCPPEECLGPELNIERTAKTLIRLGGCPGWSESSLGAQPHCRFCHVVGHLSYTLYEPEHDKTSTITCASSENSDQPVHLQSLISAQFDQFPNTTYHIQLHVSQHQVSHVTRKPVFGNFDQIFCEIRLKPVCSATKAS